MANHVITYDRNSGRHIPLYVGAFNNLEKSQARTPIDEQFASRWRVNPSWQVWQYLNFALHTPRSRVEWLDFLHSSPWFAAVQSSLADADQLFDSEGLTVATYALRQTQPELGPHTDPWILNALYCNQTCEPNGSGRPEHNFWMVSFRSGNFRDTEGI